MAQNALSLDDELTLLIYEVDQILGQGQGESEMIELQHELPLDDEELDQLLNQFDQELGLGEYYPQLYYRGE